MLFSVYINSWCMCRQVLPTLRFVLEGGMRSRLRTPYLQSNILGGY